MNNIKFNNLIYCTKYFRFNSNFKLHLIRFDTNEFMIHLFYFYIRCF